MKDYVVVVHGCFYCSGSRTILGGHLITLATLLASAERYTREDAESMRELCKTARFVEFPSGNGGMPDRRPKVVQVFHRPAERMEARDGD